MISPVKLHEVEQSPLHLINFTEYISIAMRMLAYFLLTSKVSPVCNYLFTIADCTNLYLHLNLLLLYNVYRLHDGKGTLITIFIFRYIYM